MNNKPDRTAPSAADTTQMPAINGHTRPKQAREAKPIALVVYLAVLVALGGAVWATLETGAGMPVKIAVTAFCASLALLVAAPGIQVRRPKP